MERFVYLAIGTLLVGVGLRSIVRREVAVSLGWFMPMRFVDEHDDQVGVTGCPAILVGCGEIAVGLWFWRLAARG
ncbi:hypothetical protein [Lysobacter humi (ex Lee et al. 2017)]